MHVCMYVSTSVFFWLLGSQNTKFYYIKALFLCWQPLVNLNCQIVFTSAMEACAEAGQYQQALQVCREIMRPTLINRLQ